jgi:hypothetical protein
MRTHVGYPAAMAVAALTLAACGSGAGGGSVAKPTLSITTPMSGATVQLPLTVTYSSSVPLGPPESGRDHVHMFTDGKTDQYTVVPTTSFVIKTLTPGRHTIGVTLQHADHSPAGASAEVTVVVTGPGPGGSGGPSPADSSTPSSPAGGDYSY